MSIFNKIWLVPVILSTMILSSCGGGSDGMPAVNLDEPPSATATDVPIIGPDILPLESAAGAETGFKGCLNRALYFNGPHFISTTEAISTTLYEDTFNTTEMKDVIYTVVEITSNGVANVDVETTTVSSNGNGSTGVAPMILSGHTLFWAEAGRDNPEAAILLLDYDVDVGETVSKTTTLASGDERTEERTYVGREEITVAGQQVAACRLDRLFTIPSELPEFRVSSRMSTWYGVGTGLKLREDGVAYPDSQDRSTTLKTLQSAVINGITIF